MSGRHYLTDCVLWETITFWHKHYFPCVSCFISAVFKLYFLTSHSWNASCSQFLSCQSRLYNVWPTLAVEHRGERFSIIPRPDVSLRLPSINVCSEYLCYLYTFFLVLPLVLCPGLSLLYGLAGNWLCSILIWCQNHCICCLSMYSIHDTKPIWFIMSTFCLIWQH